MIEITIKCLTLDEELVSIVLKVFISNWKTESLKERKMQL